MDALHDTHATKPIHWDEFSGPPVAPRTGSAGVVPPKTLNLQIELGRSHVERSETQELRTGSVIPLDNLAGDPVDLYADGQLIGRGEVLELGGKLAVRVVQLATGRPA